MSQNQVEEKILHKIYKLFALAGNNPSEAEAAAAMSKAQELLAQHNLSMAQIDQAHGKKTIEDQTVGRTKAEPKRSAMFVWQRQLWEHLAEANFCMYWSQKIFHASGVYSNHQHYLLGREDNVATVQAMGDYLESWLSRNCPYKVGKDVHLWKLGAVERINQRLDDKRRSMEMQDTRPEAETAEGQHVRETGLVLRTVYQTEVHGNHLFRYGNDSWCPCEPCSNKRHAEYKARQATMPVVRESQNQVEKPETDKERQARLKRQAQWNAQWERQQQKEWEKRNSRSFQEGYVDGGKAGLNSQVKGNKKEERQ